MPSSDEPNETPEQPAGDEPAAAEAPAGSAHSHRTMAERVQQDQGLPTAPSIGPHTHIEAPVHHEHAPGEGPSDVDAMGLDKRREVVGGSYSPTKGRILITFATFFAVVAALTIGFFLLAKELDQPPETSADEAPWAQPDAPQNPVPQLQ